jgi:hypothetical protein
MDKLTLKDSLQGTYYDKYIEYQRPFVFIFNRPLSPYFNRELGFDLLKFDAHFTQTLFSEQSFSDAVVEKYGETGLYIIKMLLRGTEADRRVKLPYL